MKLPLLTLIDTLDTLIVMGNYSEFRRAVNILVNFFSKEKFDYDMNISVFESTIRILGGLLSAHLLAVDPKLKIYVSAMLIYFALILYSCCIFSEFTMHSFFLLVLDRVKLIAQCIALNIKMDC